MAVALPAAGAGTPTLEGRENSFRQENRTSRFQLKCFWHLRYLWEKPYPGTTSPILTHTLCGLVLGGQVLLHLLRSPSLALADRTAGPEWNTSQHHSVQRGGAVTDTLRRGLSPLPKAQQGTTATCEGPSDAGLSVLRPQGPGGGEGPTPRPSHPQDTMTRKTRKKETNRPKA